MIGRAGFKQTHVASREVIQTDNGARREVLELECGHVVTRALRKRRPYRVICTACAEGAGG